MDAKKWPRQLKVRILGNTPLPPHVKYVSIFKPSNLFNPPQHEVLDSNSSACLVVPGRVGRILQC